MKKIIIIFTLLFSLFAMADFDNVRNEWMKGYTKLEAADKAAKAKRNEEAIPLYRTALAIFESVQRRYPQWNPTLLNYRINYCRQMLEQLTSTPEVKPESLSPNELVKLNKEYTNTIAQLSEERRFLESRVEVLTESLERARAEAAKAANVETSLTAASKSRKKLEETNNLLQLRLREANKELETLKKGTSSSDKDSAKTLQKLQKTEDLLRQSQADLAKITEDLKNSRNQVDGLNKAYEKLKHEKDEQAGVLDTLRELAQNRLTDIESLQSRLRTAQKNTTDLEKTLQKREAALEKLKKKGIKEDEGGELSEDLQVARAKNVSLNEELLTLKGEYDKLRRQLQASEEQRIKLSDRITSDTQGWKDSAKDEKTKGKQMAQMQKELEEALTAQKQLQQRLDAQIELTRRQEENITALTTDDSDNPNLARKIILQKAQIEKLATANNALNEQLKDADPLARKSLATIQNLHQQIADNKKKLERANQEITELKANRDKEAADQNAALKKATEELDMQKPDQGSQDPEKWKTLYEKNLNLAKQAIAKESEAHGRIRLLEDRYLEAQEQLDEREKELVAVQNALAVAEIAAREAQSKLAAADLAAKTVAGQTGAAKGLSTSLADTTKDLQSKNLAINTLQTKISVLEAQLRDADERATTQNKNLSALAEGDDDKTKWVDHIKQLTARLEQEQKHRRALEMALAEKETSVQESKAVDRQAVDNGPDMQEERRRREREKDAVLKGYLRQAIDAEKQEKVEAAQWNYQKVLEMEPENRIALQRLGIIAANLGNDQDTIKYLQRAFRQDPDDPDTLFALGYSLIHQSEPDWAVSMLARAVALNPKNPDIARTYGMALATLGWTQAAEIQLEKAHNLKKEDPEAPLALAILLGSAKPPRLDEAKKWYQIAIQNGAQHDPGLDAVLK
jgi:chromosome segregation ATPase